MVLDIFRFAIVFWSNLISPTVVIFTHNLYLNHFYEAFAPNFKEQNTLWTFFFWYPSHALIQPPIWKSLCIPTTTMSHKRNAGWRICKAEWWYGSAQFPSLVFKVLSATLIEVSWRKSQTRFYWKQREILKLKVTLKWHLSRCIPSGPVEKILLLSFLYGIYLLDHIEHKHWFQSISGLETEHLLDIISSTLQ